MIRPRSLARLQHRGRGLGRRLLGLPVLHQLDALHQAHAAHLADDGCFSCSPSRRVRKCAPTVGRVVHQLVLAMTSTTALAAAIVTGLPPNVAIVEPLEGIGHRRRGPRWRRWDGRCPGSWRPR